ncbi:Fic family protein [Peptacetobacter sp.]|uniref:Fic family protein n=1 Tax=Peptacetobacter sp. TaxID=2991975 RepID=UPI002E767635|nr:Fic family protein [Peptacetobacter sp.]MEE0452431.1 Fic family protein [Peptacetobacter sp.]
MKKPYIPFDLPLNELVDVNYFLNELIDAATYLTLYDKCLAKSKLDPSLLMGHISLKEAVQSTRIEGTQATLSDMLEHNADEKIINTDILEVLNYSKALSIGESMLRDFPISVRFIKRLHSTLLEGNVRGKNRNPGELRSIQNFIGPSGCTINNATFIPPEPQLVPEYMSNLEKYINEPEDNLNELIRIAIIHAQFETIHPFLDGNGRIGRILIPLYLYDKSVLKRPIFFLSESLEKDKFKYYKLLNDVRVSISEDNYESDFGVAKKNWCEWIKFFLEAVTTQSQKNIDLIERIDTLYEETIDSLRKVIGSDRVIDIARFMLKNPIFTKKKMSEELGYPVSTVGNYLSKLENENIIFSDGRVRNKKYYLYSLIEILN